jgi:hypothetical protein
MSPSLAFDLISDEREESSPSDERDSPKNTQAVVARDPSFEVFDESNNPFREVLVAKQPFLTPLPISDIDNIVDNHGATKAVIQKYRLKSVPHPRIDAHDDEEAQVFSQSMAECIKTNVDPINEEQQPTTPSTLQLSTLDGSQSELGSLNTVNVQASVPHRRPGGDAPNRYDVSVSPINIKQAQVVDVYVPFERRPGGGAPNRYDTNLSSINFRHQSDLDMSFASMDLTPDLTPPVDDIVADSSSKQPELSLLEQALTSRHEEKNRRHHQNRSRSQNFTHQRMRSSRRRSISSDTQRPAMMCGPVHEIQESVQDVTYSIQQIIRSIRQFGPKERDAVMETLHEAGYFIRQKCKPEEVCGPIGSNAYDAYDYDDDDIGRASDDTKNRSIVMSDNLINLVGSEISLTNNVDDSKTTIYGTRSSSDLSDQYMSDISSVVYKMPIDTNIFRSRRPGRSRRF